MLLTVTAINHRFFLNLVCVEWTDLRNSSGIESRNFYLNHVELNSGTSKSSIEVKNPIRLKILTYESPMKSYIKKGVKLLQEQIQFKSHFLKKSPRFTILVIQWSPESLENLTT